MARLNILVIGLGYFGESLALELMQLGHEVLGIDGDLDVIEKNAPALAGALQMDPTNLQALRTVEIPSFDICIVGRGSNLEESVLIALNLKELGARKIVCKAVTDQQRKILERIGADQIVQPERDMGKRLAHIISTSDAILDQMTFPGNCGLEELAAPSEWIDKTLGDLQLSSRFGLQVLLIKCGERIETTPAPDTKIQDGAVLVLFGENRKLTQFERSQLS